MKALSEPTHEIDGKKVHVGEERAGSHMHRQTDTSIRMVNLAVHTNEDSLEHYLSQFGPLVCCEVTREASTGLSKGLGNATFVDKEGVGIISTLPASSF
jgi:RNA recognition motif-containing protein